MSLRRRTWQILEVARPGDRLSRAFDIGILFLITFNIAAVILETIAGIAARYGHALLWIERISVAVFTIEYIARVWAAPEDSRYAGELRGRLRYSASPMAVIDLLAVLPYFLPFLGLDLRFVRAFRLLRLVRIAKAARYVAALRLFRAVATSKREELILVTGILALLLLVASSVMYFAENAAQPAQILEHPGDDVVGSIDGDDGWLRRHVPRDTLRPSAGFGRCDTRRGAVRAADGDPRIRVRR